ncbi:hypothetical protein BJX96DRAFT_48052 [Aspergillus floccosus]
MLHCTHLLVPRHSGCNDPWFHVCFLAFDCSVGLSAFVFIFGSVFGICSMEGK